MMETCFSDLSGLHSSFMCLISRIDLVSVAVTDKLTWSLLHGPYNSSNISLYYEPGASEEFPDRTDECFF